MQLSEVPVGTTYTIDHYKEIDPVIQVKLLSLGLIPGSEVQVERKTWGNKTLYIRVNQTSTYAIRSNEAAIVTMR